MIHRYWRTALMASRVAFLLGGVVFGLATITGNPQARTGQTIGDFIRAVLVYGSVDSRSAWLLFSTVSFWSPSSIGT